VNEKTELKIRELIKNDDPCALDIIYDELGERLYKYLLVILCSKDNAEEVMQELFALIGQKRNKLAKADNLASYIFAMARNRAMDFLRQRPVREENIEDYKNILFVKDNVADEISDEEIKEVTQALGSLPQEQKEIISMKIFEEMTFKDISETLSISENTAASRYRYGIDKLRRALQKAFSP
jgi:RNA polymerase sigma-70 factor (ECF subfamily)